MATVLTQTDSANQTITIGLGSLASSATFTAGRESTQIDNTSNNYLDATVFGRVTVGTTPTVDTSIMVYVYGADESLATTPIGTVMDGTDSDETITTTSLNSSLAFAAAITVLVGTSDITYNITPFSVTQSLGLTALPKFWGLFVAHDTVAALHATAGNHVFEYVGHKYTNT